MVKIRVGTQTVSSLTAFPFKDVAFGIADDEGRLVRVDPYEPTLQANVDPTEVIKLNTDTPFNLEVPPDTNVIRGVLLPDTDMASPVWGYVKIGPHWFAVLEAPKEIADRRWSLRLRRPPLEPNMVEVLGLEERANEARHE